MLIKIFATILASCCSSFTVLCAKRTGCGQTPWSPARSYCDHCRHPLCWWQLIPLLGFIIQGGKCAFCHQRISPYESICEFSCGLFTWLLATPAIFHSLMAVVAIQTLLFIFTCDYFFQCLYPLSLTGLFSLTFLIPVQLTSAAVDAAISLGFIALLAFFAIKLRWLGSGDVLYIGIITLLFGAYHTALIILLACCIILSAFLLTKRPARLPFLPALCFSTLLILTIINY